MTDSTLNVLPPQARKRIEILESQVSELTGALGLIVSEMQRQGLSFPIKKTSSPLLKTIARHAAPIKPARNKARQSTTGLAAAVARGEAAKLDWVSSGEVIPAKTLAYQLGLTPQALGPAAERGEVFALVVKRQRYFPKEFLELDRDVVASVSQALGHISPAEKLVFWKRPHGALGGKTVLQVLTGPKSASMLARVEQLAKAWAADTQARKQ